MLHLLFVYKTTRWSINNFKHGNDNALNKLFKDAERNETHSQQGMTMNFARTLLQDLDAVQRLRQQWQTISL